MEKLKKNSMRAHIWLAIISAIIIIIVVVTKGWLNGIYTFISIYTIATIVYLFFYIPLERGRLKKSSLRFRWLAYHNNEKRFNGTENKTAYYSILLDDDGVPEVMNNCYLPGLIMIAIFYASVEIIFYPMFFVVGIIGGNIVWPLLFDRYIVFSRDNRQENIFETKDMPFSTSFNIGEKKSIKISLWMLVLVIGIGLLLWVYGSVVWSIILAFFKTLIPLLILKIVGIVVVVVLVIWFFLWIEFFTSIKNLFQAFDDKYCITRNVLDE